MNQYEKSEADTAVTPATRAAATPAVCVLVPVPVSAHLDLSRIILLLSAHFPSNPSCSSIAISTISTSFLHEESSKAATTRLSPWCAITVKVSQPWNHNRQRHTYRARHLDRLDLERQVHVGLAAICEIYGRSSLWRSTAVVVLVGLHFYRQRSTSRRGSSTTRGFQILVVRAVVGCASKGG